MAKVISRVFLVFCMLTGILFITNFKVEAIESESAPLAFSIGSAVSIYDDCNALFSSMESGLTPTSAYFLLGSEKVRVPAHVEVVRDIGWEFLDGYSDGLVIYFPPNGYRGIDYSGVDFAAASDLSAYSNLIVEIDGKEYMYGAASGSDPMGDGVVPMAYVQDPGSFDPCSQVPDGTGSTPFPVENYRQWFPVDNIEGSDSQSAFPDIAGNVFEDYISDLYEKGVINGYSDGNYYPEREVSRGAMAKFVKNGFNIPTDLSCGDFPDVTPGMTFYEEITSLKCNGIIKGYSDGTYKSDNGVTRGAVTKFVMKALESKGVQVDYTLSNNFPDVYDSHTFYKHISYLTNIQSGDEKVIKGYSSGYYMPDDVLNRGAMAKIVQISSTAMNSLPMGEPIE